MHCLSQRLTIRFLKVNIVLFRSKVGTPPHLTDREIFEQLPLGDVWHDAHMLEAWDFLWNHALTSVPDSWLECMTRFDREFRDTIGS